MATFTHPLPGATRTTRFGAPNAVGGGTHTGTDYAYSGGSCGRRVLAAAAGVARRAENAGGGHGIVIDHGGGIETGYWHLSSQLVRDGQQVAQGQVIGLVGASGTRVTGCHLHYELKVNGVNVDPEPFLAGNVAAIPEGAPDSFPVDDGTTCPPGYVKAWVDPRFHGWLPGSPWWNRPTNAEGLVLACVRQGLKPGDNTALTDVGEGIGQAVAGLLPIAANGAIILVALVMGWTGVKQVLGIGSTGVTPQLLAALLARRGR